MSVGHPVMVLLGLPVIMAMPSMKGDSDEQEVQGKGEDGVIIKPQ